MFRIQKVSNYGTATPAVARTFFQGCDILEFFHDATKSQREEAKGVLHELQRHLVNCVEISDAAAGEVAAARAEVEANGPELQSHRRVVTLPSVPDLQSRAESFLQSAKMAIRQTASLLTPFFGVKHDHRYHKLLAWAEEKFGADDRFTRAIRDWEPWVKEIVAMRNAVDHPDDRPGGKLVTTNFSVRGVPPALHLVEPTWGLSGGLQRAMIPEMCAVVEGTIELGEEILAGLLDKFKGNFPVVVYEIPADARDLSCPVRLRVGLAR